MLNARPVRGPFRRLRWAADGVLIAILLVTPWITIAGEPLVRLDIPARRFHVFGLVIFPQEMHFLWLIVIGLAFTLFFVTALLGRIWCGWACPQTVLTDVYAAVARWIEGWSPGGPPPKVALWRRVLKHGAFVVMSLVLSFHLVSYFVGPHELLSGLRSGFVTSTQLGFLGFFTLLWYGDLVFLRQTFCRFLCPYARFQSVLFDGDTLVIAYDSLRGEPRARGMARRDSLASATRTGDCVDCGLCVAVCPSSIDIRGGMQVDCVACTQCIDACNGVMARIGQAPNLIGYRSLVGLERIRKVKIVRPRVLVYGAMLASVLIAFGTVLAQRQPIGMVVFHNAGALYGAAADGRASNVFVLRIENRDRADHVYRLRLEAPEGYEMVAGVNPIPVPAVTAQESRVFVLHDTHAGGPPVVPLQFVLEQEGDARRMVRRSVQFVSAGQHANLGGTSGGH